MLWVGSIAKASGRRLIILAFKPGVYKYLKQCRSHFKIQGRSKFHSEDPQMLGATVKVLVAWNLCTSDLNVKNTNRNCKLIVMVQILATQ
jgi:hypothetical protein